ncbi:MAG TPA: mercury resistance system periplasmic binding protein MerP [Acidiferrobacteraceae bacterium]|nr:mercury resistance system periplasmic binding protein MerP [Acidiferrobacteraceae bacterium]
MRKFLLSFALLGFIAATNLLITTQAAETKQATETKTVTLNVQNMTCALCPLTVRKSLEKVKGVIKAEASFDTKTATVTFDPAKTTVEALTKATADAGYPSKLKE